MDQPHGRHRVDAHAAAQCGRAVGEGPAVAVVSMRRAISVRALSAASAAAAILSLAVASPASAQSRLLRFPDIHGDRVVFTHGGDQWLAPAAGGSATQLTSHQGLELFAKFSPDGWKERLYET